MQLFDLPDLGEGLPDATILRWHVKEGNEVTIDQLLVTVETAKASVEIPSPFTGKILKLFGQENEVIKTGSPLLGFEGIGYVAQKKGEGIVGKIESTRETMPNVSVCSQRPGSVQATPAAQALARKLKVELQEVIPSGPCITPEDIQKHIQKRTQTCQLAGIRLGMARSMLSAQSQVLPSTCSSEIDIENWLPNQNITMRILRAIVLGCKALPLFNAHFYANSESYTLNEKINVGIAVSSGPNLFLPVLKDVANRPESDLRANIDQFKEKAKSGSFSKEDLEGATILFSNFGTMGIRYATPVIVPPAVAIVGIGASFEKLILLNEKVVQHKMLPVVLTINHVFLTGRESAQFMKIITDDLGEKL